MNFSQNLVRKIFENSLLSNTATIDSYFQRDTLLVSKKNEWKMCGSDTHLFHLLFDVDCSLSLNHVMLILEGSRLLWRDEFKVIFLRVPKEKSLEPGVLVDGFLLHTGFLFCL